MAGFVTGRLKTQIAGIDAGFCDQLADACVDPVAPLYTCRLPSAGSDSTRMAVLASIGLSISVTLKSAHVKMYGVSSVPVTPPFP
ncbi:MAG: hypothetical protein R3E84_10135 [Pseudomonadales bacterium]